MEPKIVAEPQVVNVSVNEKKPEIVAINGKEYPIKVIDGKKYAIVALNGKEYFLCPYSHGQVGMSTVEVEALFPSIKALDQHLADWHNSTRSRRKD